MEFKFITFWIISTLILVSALDEDFIDPESEEDDENTLKCDACTIVVKKVSNIIISYLSFNLIIINFIHIFVFFI